MWYYIFFCIRAGFLDSFWGFSSTEVFLQKNGSITYVQKSRQLITWYFTFPLHLPESTIIKNLSHARGTAPLYINNVILFAIWLMSDPQFESHPNVLLSRATPGTDFQPGFPQSSAWNKDLHVGTLFRKWSQRGGQTGRNKMQKPTQSCIIKLITSMSDGAWSCWNQQNAPQDCPS